MIRKIDHVFSNSRTKILRAYLRHQLGKNRCKRIGKVFKSLTAFDGEKDKSTITFRFSVWMKEGWWSLFLKEEIQEIMLTGVLLGEVRRRMLCVCFGLECPQDIKRRCLTDTMANSRSSESWETCLLVNRTVCFICQCYRNMGGGYTKVGRVLFLE